MIADMSSYSANYRRALKESDPDKYEREKEKQRLRQAKRRENLKNEMQKSRPSNKAKEKCEKIREQGRKSQAAFRKRKSHGASVSRSAQEKQQNQTSCSTASVTRSAQEKQDNQASCSSASVTRSAQDKQENQASCSHTATSTQKLKIVFRFHGKKSATAVNPPAAPQTRTALSNKRAYWRAKRQESRARESGQKKRRIRENDRKQKGVKREEERKIKEEDRKTREMSEKTTWNATSRIRKEMPKGPQLFAGVVNGLMANSSPRKRKAMESLGITPPPPKRKCAPKFCLQEVIKQMSKKKEGMAASKLLAITARKIKLRASSRLLSSSLGLNKKTILRSHNIGVGRVSRRDKLTKRTVEMVQKFFKTEHISRPLPQKRYATKAGPGYVLQIALKAAYLLFKKEYPNIKIGYTKFTLLRPKNVRLLSAMLHDVCMCPYCLNLKYKLLSLNRLVSSQLKVSDERDFLNVLLCKKSDGARYHRAECVWGNCTECKSYGATINQFYEEVIQLNPVAIWNHWERKSCDDGKIRRVIVTKQGSVKELVAELVKDVECPVQGVTFPEHVFVASWQYYQYNQLKDNLPQGWILMVMDFAQNRKVFFQDEIKSAHFSQKQITMHPIVVYRDDTSGHLIRESLVFLSDDTGHDSHAVEFYLQGAIKHLENENADIRRIVIFSDGCASQYKSKINFADISLASHPTERNYYGSEHGKGEGDGEIGVINRGIDRAVLGRQVIIRNGEELYEWCSDNLVSDMEFSKRKFFHVKVGDISRNREDRNVMPLKGSRKLHQIQGNGAYSVKVRQLSCFCASCKVKAGPGISHTPCINTSYVGVQKVNVLKRVGISDGPDTAIPTKVKCRKMSKRRTVSKCVNTPAKVDAVANVPVQPVTTLLTDKVSECPKTQNKDGPVKILPDPHATQPTEVKCKDKVSKYQKSQKKVEAVASVPSQPDIEIKVGLYYAVFYDTKPYFGRIIAIEDSEVQVKFLHSISATTFAWPRRDDIAFVNKRLICYGPVDIVGHGPFTITCLEHALNKHIALKKDNKLKE